MQSFVISLGCVSVCVCVLANQNFRAALRLDEEMTMHSSHNFIDCLLSGVHIFYEG